MVEIYRFRSMEKLLGSPYQELERQSISFSGLEDLNDPMEGFRDIVWSGDVILWTNLFRHYVFCLVDFAVNAINFQRHNFVLEDYIVPIVRRWDVPPTPEADQLFKAVWQKVRDQCGIAEFANRIADMLQQVRRG